MTLKTPQALLHGHENLYKQIESIKDSSGTISKKANELYELLDAHFQKEEKYALPPLSLLLVMSESNWEIDTNAAIELTNEFNSIVKEMKEEHENIEKVLEELKIIADETQNEEAKRFVKDLKLHVEVEDEVLYPATILIGNYLKKFETN